MQKRKIIYQLWRDLYAVYVFLFVYVIVREKQTKQLFPHSITLDLVCMC